MNRPVLRYHGGKYRIAPWIISYFPEHRIYVEPFGGAASVLMQKPRAFAEVYNDLDDSVVNVFRVLRDPIKSQELEKRCRLTPFSRTEFNESYTDTNDDVEDARRTIVRSFMGHGGSSRRAYRTGFRARAYRQNQTGAQDWVNWPDEIANFTKRLQGVCIENRDAFEVIAQQDSSSTLFYVDPPYVHSTRTSHTGHGKNAAYAHELTDEDHEKLIDVLISVRGMVVISAYESKIYNKLLEKKWYVVRRQVLADAGAKRVECLYISPRALDKLQLLWKSEHL